MKKFIRLDFDKGFRGSEHRSSFTGDGEHFEDGISCYEISEETIVDSINELAKYWFETASECDFSKFDINIFEGEKVGYGADWEDLATCENHLHCIDGKLFDSVYELYWAKYDEEISEEEYEIKIKNLFKKYI